MLNFFTQRMRSVWGLLLAAAILPAPAVAEEVLQRIPQNALGFAIVRNMSETSTKVEQLLEPFDVIFPAPLAFAKLVTGLDAGLETSGDLLIALLPSEGQKTAALPMVLLPINSYSEFAASINADSSGEICRATLLGEDILVARDGSHAMLMNVEDRETMEKLLARAAKPPAALTPLASWLPKQDVALVLMPPGIEQLSSWRRPPTRRRDGDFGILKQRSMLSHVLTMFSRSEVSGSGISDWVQSNVEIVAIGVSVDDQSNVRLGEQLILKENSPLAKYAPKSFPATNLTLGLSDQLPVFTAGGPVAPGWGKQLAKLLRQAEQAEPAQHGLDKLTPKQWDQEEQFYRLLFEDICSCSVVMLPGAKGEPLLGNFLGVATVTDVSKYLKSLPQFVEIWTELTQQSASDFQPDFELVEKKIAGNLGYEIVVDIATTARDPRVPMTNWMLEAMLGPEGKLRLKFAQVNQTTFVFGLATDEQMSELLQMAQKDKSTTSQPAEMQTTLALLEPTAPWQMLIRTQGCLHWASRVANEFWVLLNNTEVTIPEMPNSPPVGLTVNWIDRRLECELVCPAATWETLGKYVETLTNQ